MSLSLASYLTDFYFKGDYYYYDSSINLFIFFPPIDLSASLRARTWSPLSFANKALTREYLDFIISNGTYEIYAVSFFFACFLWCSSLYLLSLAFAWESISLTRTYLLFIINYPLPRASKISMLKIPYSVSLFFSKIFSSPSKYPTLDSLLNISNDGANNIFPESGYSQISYPRNVLMSR